jgi:transposase
MATSYSQEFKDQIVEQHRRGRSFMELGKEFNIAPTSISNWVRAADRREAAAKRSKKSAQSASGEAGVESDKAKIRRLERELARKEEELEILGKALAFFARKTDQ